ncbi:MAG TPA: transporter substrate-binding domain-containing protein, partial [Holophaga sp.]|nr:transporter substrate-binding domain-containing protein [Holophaga sp.]
MAADPRRKTAWRLPWLCLLLLCAALHARPLPRKLAFAISDYPPFEYAENGVPKGMSVEITRMVFQKMGYDITIALYPWKRALHMVRTGEVDGIFSASRTREREAYGVFPKESLVDGGTYFFALQDSTIAYDGDLAKLAGYTIGTDRGSSYGDRFDE